MPEQNPVGRHRPTYAGRHRAARSGWLSSVVERTGTAAPSAAALTVLLTASGAAAVNAGSSAPQAAGPDRAVSALSASAPQAPAPKPQLQGDPIVLVDRTTDRASRDQRDVPDEALIPIDEARGTATSAEIVHMEALGADLPGVRDANTLVNRAAKRRSTTQSSDAPAESENSVQYHPPIVGSRIVSYYGYRVHPTLGYWKLHQGLDYTGYTGQPVFAVASGTVIRASRLPIMGKSVELQLADGTVAVYEHLSGYSTFDGQQVRAGDVIGYVGSTGRSTGPHLHLGIKVGGSFVNPYGWLSRRGLV